MLAKEVWDSHHHHALCVQCIQELLQVGREPRNMEPILGLAWSKYIRFWSVCMPNAWKYIHSSLYEHVPVFDRSMTCTGTLKPVHGLRSDWTHDWPVCRQSRVSVYDTGGPSLSFVPIKKVQKRKTNNKTSYFLFRQEISYMKFRVHGNGINDDTVCETWGRLSHAKLTSYYSKTWA